MPFKYRLVCRAISLVIALSLPALVQAETKTIVSEAIYAMGDGETPSFAEAMVLQKAKQIALEHAGTYVESYTKVQNLSLTTEEIQTIAGGVLEVEVLEKTRTLVGDGLHFYVKIKATVTTDKMEELANRIKGRNVAEEYRRLQEDYVRLNKEIETWKRLIAKTPSGPEREAALDQIREREKAFASVQKNESAFFQRLVAGHALVGAALDEQALVDQLVQTIIEEGQLVEVGEAKANTVRSKPGQIMLTIPVTMRISDLLIPAISNATGKLNGLLRSKIRLDNRNAPLSEKKMFRVGSNNSISAIGTLVRLANDYQTAAYFQARIRSLALQLRFTNSTEQTAVCFKHLWNDWALEPLSYSRLVPVVKIWFYDRDPGKAYIDWVNELVLSPCLKRRYKNPQGKIEEGCLPVDDERRQSTIDSQYSSDPGAGFVMVLDEPAVFVIEVRLPQEVVQDIKQIDARIVEASRDTAQPKGSQVYCSITP